MKTVDWPDFGLGKWNIEVTGTGILFLGNGEKNVMSHGNWNK